MGVRSPSREEINQAMQIRLITSWVEQWQCLICNRVISLENAVSEEIPREYIPAGEIEQNLR